MRENKNQGITLIALVITIIILIILAGITIGMIVGENGLISKAQQAKSDTENASIQSEEQLNELVSEIDKNLDGENNKEFDFNLTKYPDSKSTNAIFADISFEKTYKEYATEEVKKLTQKQKEEYFLTAYNKRSESWGDPTYATIEEFLQAEAVTSVEDWVKEWTSYNSLDEFLVESRAVEFYEFIKPTGVEGGGSQSYEDTYDRRYLITKNGEYTFGVKQLKTGEIKNKTIQVNNITVVDTYEIRTSGIVIKLYNKEDQVVGFQNAYMLMGDNIVNVNGAIQSDNLAYYAQYDGDLQAGDYTVVIEKDGQLYIKVCYLFNGPVE
ncbi:MAG: hypothetical protein ACLTEH_01085 [Clostridia bacterium]